MSPRMTLSQLSCHNARSYFACISLIGSPERSHQMKNDVLNRDSHDQEEYRALRATIRERGTARVCLFAGGFAAWGALTLAAATMASTPLATLLPLLVLAALFEAIYAPTSGRAHRPLHSGLPRKRRAPGMFSRRC